MSNSIIAFVRVGGGISRSLTREIRAVLANWIVKARYPIYRCKAHIFIEECYLSVRTLVVVKSLRFLVRRIDFLGLGDSVVGQRSYSSAREPRARARRALDLGEAALVELEPLDQRVEVEKGHQRDDVEDGELPEADLQEGVEALLRERARELGLVEQHVDVLHDGDGTERLALAPDPRLARARDRFRERRAVAGMPDVVRPLEADLVRGVPLRRKRHVDGRSRNNCLPVARLLDAQIAHVILLMRVGLPNFRKRTVSKVRGDYGTVLSVLL